MMNSMTTTRGRRRAPWLAGAACLGLTLVFIAAAMPAMADTRFEESLKLEPGGKLIVDTSAGSVEIRGTSRSGARIVVTSSRDDLKDRYDFKFEEGPGTVTITSRKKGYWINWNGNGAPQFQIEVPERTVLEVGTGGGHVQVMSINGDANLKTSGGHMEISSLTGKLMAKTSGGHIKLRKIDGDTTISTSGGHIEVEGLNGTLDARTSGGHVSLKSVSGNIDTHTSGGHIDIENAGGRVEAQTSGGSIEVGFAHGNVKGGHLASSGGGIRVAVDKTADLDVDAETGGGHVTTDMPITTTLKSRAKLKGTLGHGGEPLIIRTSGGPIEIASN